MLPSLRCSIPSDIKGEKLQFAYNLYEEFWLLSLVSPCLCVCLRSTYAMPGTDAAYDASRALCNARD